MPSRASCLVCALLLSAPILAGERPPAEGAGAPIDFSWGVRIPMRDGARLSATLYRPHDQKEPLPCIFTLTPYIAQRSHDRGVYFAAHGYVFLTVDVRGRGDSEGRFNPFVQEANDGPDVVEWLARQSYCNGKVAMWGISYAGYDQWATAKGMPPHLATIVPGASPRPGLDFPWVNGVYYPYDIQWITFTSGHASQEVIFDDDEFWAAQFGKMYSGHRAFGELDAIVGNPSPIFQTWVAHQRLDDYSSVPGITIAPSRLRRPMQRVYAHLAATGADGRNPPETSHDSPACGARRGLATVGGSPVAAERVSGTR